MSPIIFSFVHKIISYSLFEVYEDSTIKKITPLLQDWEKKYQFLESTYFRLPSPFLSLFSLPADWCVSV